MNRRSFQSALVVTLVILFSISCGLFTGTPQASATGNIRVVNYHVRASDPFPGGTGLPDTREYGICFIAYPPIAGIIKPDFDTIVAKDGLQDIQKQQITWSLPAGTYTLQEWQFDSEVNQDPLYSPAFRTLVRVPESVVVNADETTDFGSQRTHEAPSEFVEGTLLNPNCAGASASAGGHTTTEEGIPEVPLTESEVPQSDTPEAGTGVWVLKQVEPDLGKTEVPFSYPGLACDGGTKVASTEAGATITANGTCQVNGAQVANQTATYSWTRPPDQLTPGEEISLTITAASSGLCSWTGAATEDGCTSSVTTRHTVWQGDGGPWTGTDFPYSDLVYDSGNAGESANAKTDPSPTVTWTVPDGSTGSGKTLVVLFIAHASGGSVQTNFWYEWQGP